MDTTAKQMQMAFMFEEGGIADDGMNVDPVSGNEIPPGSLAKEVRDDVPAQLSEGEYVVPADVVRFYGVKFFEDLRGEAKRGLMDMEANGRIGGEPVAQTMANQTGGDLTPEELAAIQAATGMAMGGAVAPVDPYMQQQQMYQQPAPQAVGNTTQYNQGGQVLYAAPGTDVSPPVTNPTTGADAGIDPYKPQFGATQGSMFAPGFLIDQTLGTTAPAITTVILYGPNGEVETLTLPAQQARYDELLQLGYTQEPVATTTETSVGQDDDQPPAPTQQPDTTPVDYSKMSDDQLKASARSFNMIATVGTALASTMGLPIAAIVNTGAAAKYNDLLDTMKSRGISTEGMERKGSIFGGESSILENLKDTSGDGKVSFADTWLGDFLGFDGAFGIAEGKPGLKESFGGARRTSGTTTTTTTSTPKKSSGNVGDDNGPTGAPRGTSTNVVSGPMTSSPKPVARPSSSPKNTVSKTAASEDAYNKTESIEQKVKRGGGFKEGGMVKRRNNTKKKK